MAIKAAFAVAMLLMVLSTAPLPHSEEGIVSLAPGGQWDLPIELGADAHVTFIVRSNGPVEVAVAREGGGEEVNSGKADPISLYRFSGTLQEGAYRLVITNPGGGEVGIEYQVHRDYLVVANMTAKNVMALSLALAIGIAALALALRSRRS